MSSPQPALTGTSSFNFQSVNNRILRQLADRVTTAAKDALMPAPPQIDNGDAARYADKCGTYTKCIKQDSIGKVNLAAYGTFINALSSGQPADFENITVGGSRTLNDPQGGLAFDLEGLDSSQFSSPPAPALAGEQYAAELVELYWASLLRDVPFTQYDSNPVAAQAAAELSSLAAYGGPRDASNKVTPQLLFRGGMGKVFPGETIGPYMSQFLLQPTNMGALKIDQKYITNKAGVDYMTDKATFQQVQNGQSTGLSLQPVSAQYLHDGRGLAGLTHADVLYQEFLCAYLLLDSIRAKVNPGNPYRNLKKQNGFNTFGDPDIASTFAAVAAEALKAVWFQKWYVHLRHRPESGGALVQLVKDGSPTDGQPSATVLNSQAVKSSFVKYTSYLLSQAFPEGSPAHPAYPTGHGTVAGACITALKFFFDGSQNIRPLLQGAGTDVAVSSADGMSLVNYTSADAGGMTINGELHKLAHNVSFAHGIHAGIHWRSDTDSSILLGEAVALSVLQDRANNYNEKFTVQINKCDGTTATITNQ